MDNAVTHGQLTAALFRLGFTAHTRDEATVFTDAAHDAVIVIPDGGSESVVPVHYTAAARETVYWKGIAGRREFDRMLFSSR